MKFWCQSCVPTIAASYLFEIIYSNIILTPSHFRKVGGTGCCKVYWVVYILNVVVGDVWQAVPVGCSRHTDWLTDLRPVFSVVRVWVLWTSFKSSPAVKSVCDHCLDWLLLCSSLQCVRNNIGFNKTFIDKVKLFRAWSSKFDFSFFLSPKGWKALFGCNLTNCPGIHIVLRFSQILWLLSMAWKAWYGITSVSSHPQNERWLEPKICPVFEAWHQLIYLQLKNLCDECHRSDCISTQEALSFFFSFNRSCP